MTTTLLALLTALLLVDYPLAGVRMDLSEAPRSWQRLAGHGLAHAAVAYLLLGRPSQWILPVLAGASHLVIDGIEQQFDPRSGRVFAVASIVHVAVVAAFGLLVPPRGPSLWTEWLGTEYPSALLFTLGALLTVWLGGDAVGYLVAPFADQLPPRQDPVGGASSDRSDEPQRGFPEGGRTIGYLERALIYLFVLAGQPAGVGFLVAAKSIFRFGELRERSNRLEAEYILIGTLTSFLWGLTVAYAVRLLLAGM